jgi:ferric-dicitrate binding protein FerR (iron transport regulator)
MTRHDELIQRYFDGDLAREMEQELLALLRANKDNVRAFVREANLRRALREALVEGVSIGSEPARQAAVSHWRRVFIPLAAAAALVLAVGVWLQYRSHESGQTIATGATGALVLRFAGEDTRVEVAAKSMVKLVGGTVERDGTNGTINCGSAKVVRLESGAIRAVVAKQTEGRTFSVKSPREEMFVAGTIFSVGVSSYGSRLSVEDGRVVMRLFDSDVCETVERGQEVYTRTDVNRIFAPMKALTEKVVPELKYTDAGGLAFDGKRLWLWCVDEKQRLKSGPPRLLAVDPDSYEALKTVDAGNVFEPWSQIAWDGHYMWGHDWYQYGVNKLNAVDVETGAKARSLALPKGVGGRIHFDIRDGVAWVWYGVGKEGGDGRSWVKMRLSDGTVLGRGRLNDIDWDVERVAWLPDCVVLGERRGNRLARVDAVSGKLISVELLAKKHFWYGGDMAYDAARGLWLSSSEQVVLFAVSSSADDR